MLCTGRFKSVDNIDDLLTVDYKLSCIPLGNCKLGIIILQITVFIIDIGAGLILHRKSIRKRAVSASGGDHLEDGRSNGILQVIIHRIFSGIPAYRKISKLGILAPGLIVDYQCTVFLGFNCVFLIRGSE